MYSHHALPAGAIPVPIDQGTNKRTINNWEFHYNRYTGDPNNNFREGTTYHNMFPKEIKRQLDHNYLIKLGLNKTRVQECDALFFHSLILPIRDPSKSTPTEYPLKTY